MRMRNAEKIVKYLGWRELGRYREVMKSIAQFEPWLVTLGKSSLCFYLPICKMGIIIVPTLYGCCAYKMLITVLVCNRYVLNTV